MSLFISGATLIDGVADTPSTDRNIWIERGRIRAIGGRGELEAPAGAQVIDARGKFVIPGLMNANVHLLMDIRLEVLARYIDRYEELIAEAAQIALKNGLTTVFDTYGPRKLLMAVREKINAGEIPGSRIFCAGNIIGLDGPVSADFDFFAKSLGSASAAFARRVNAIWTENVGRQLMWMTPAQVADEVRAYIQRGVDFIKYASNDHVPGAFLAFSERAQTAIVEEAHRAGITAQAHTMSVEGLRIAIEAGCDLIQHANNSGPIPIPEETIEMLVARGAGAVVFPYTDRRLQWFIGNDSYIKHKGPREWEVSDINARNLLRAGATLLMANDGSIFAPEATSEAKIATVLSEESEGNLFSLETGHFAWFKAMEEKGCEPMRMLKAATRNVAMAYGVGADLGTLEPGKMADLLILDANPLAAADNYRAIRTVIKDGNVVDREALPLQPILTRPLDPPSEEEGMYTPFISGHAFPGCALCLPRHDP